MCREDILLILYVQQLKLSHISETETQPANGMINVRQCESAAALSTPTMDPVRVMFKSKRSPTETVLSFTHTHTNSASHKIW